MVRIRLIAREREAEESKSGKGMQISRKIRMTGRKKERKLLTMTREMRICLSPIIYPMGTLLHSREHNAYVRPSC